MQVISMAETITQIHFSKLNEEIGEPDLSTYQAALSYWDQIAKPLHGLGVFEKVISKIAALQNSLHVSIDKRALLVLCADNGVVKMNVTQTDQSVTATMADAIYHHTSCACQMAATANIDVFPIDMGMVTRVPGVTDRHIANGTNNIATTAAMTREQALLAIKTGMELVKQYKEAGYQLLATGEMGIGNTTTSSAIASVLLDLPVEQVTGRGAGLSDEGLMRKIQVIRQSIALHQPDVTDPVDVLSKLGGFDIAGMCGMFLGGALYQIPIIIDGLISSVAALVAKRLCKNATNAMIASHCSKEPAAVSILNELGLTPVVYGELKLGEGTGALMMIPLLDMALGVYHHSATFSNNHITQYEEFGGPSV